MRTKERSGAGGGSGRQSVPAPTLGAPLGGERLPTAPRERKPALAALAVLLILVGALGATVMVMRAGNKISVVEVTAPVAAGDPIPQSAIRQVMLSNDSGVSFVRWGQRNDLLNNYRAATNLVAFSVLSTTMITPADQVLVSGKSLVGLSLKDGQFPDGLKPGDVVAAYNVSATAARSSSSSSGSGTTLASSAPISNNLIVKKVLSSSGDFSSGQTSVTVQVDSADAGALTIAASANAVALVLIPGKH